MAMSHFSSISAARTFFLSLIKRELFRLYQRNRISQQTYLRIVKRLGLERVSLLGVR